jgi:hypothetical protein
MSEDQQLGWPAAKMSRTVDLNSAAGKEKAYQPRMDTGKRIGLE